MTAPSELPSWLPHARRLYRFLNSPVTFVVTTLVCLLVLALLAGVL